MPWREIKISWEACPLLLTQGKDVDKWGLNFPCDDQPLWVCYQWDLFFSLWLMTMCKYLTMFICSYVMYLWVCIHFDMKSFELHDCYFVCLSTVLLEFQINSEGLLLTGWLWSSWIRSPWVSHDIKAITVFFNPPKYTLFTPSPPPPHPHKKHFQMLLGTCSSRCKKE